MELQRWWVGGISQIFTTNFERDHRDEGMRGGYHKDLPQKGEREVLKPAL